MFSSKLSWNRELSKENSISSSKNERKAPDASDTTWSGWDWDEQRQCYWRQREDNNGCWEYQYQYEDSCKPGGPEDQDDTTSSAAGGSLYLPLQPSLPSSQKPISGRTAVPGSPSASSYADQSSYLPRRSSFPSNQQSLSSRTAILGSPYTSSYSDQLITADSGSGMKVSGGYESMGSLMHGPFFHGQIPESIEHGQSYVVIRNPHAFFKLGRAFMTMKPFRSKAEDERHGFAVCCPLQTFQKQGTSKPWVRPQDLALVYPLRVPAQAMLNEGLPGMARFPIVLEDGFTFPECDFLCLNFAQASTIEHNVKVRNIGRIDRDCLKWLQSEFLKAKGGNVLEIEKEEGQEDEQEDDVASAAVGSKQYLLGSPYRPDNIASPKDNEGHKDDEESDESDREIPAKAESLHPDFKVHPAKTFKFGRVFKTLWTEPAAGFRRPKGTEIIHAKYGEESYTSIRRFVIVRAKEGHCLCLPILTYGGQATTKRGVKPQDHAIIYTGESQKVDRKNTGKKKWEKNWVDKAIPQEVDGEEKLRKKAIRVTPSTPRDFLAPFSRLNYAKIYTVEYNVKVCFIGKIDNDSIKYFIRDFNMTNTLLPLDANTEFSDDEQ